MMTEPVRLSGKRFRDEEAPVLASVSANERRSSSRAPQNDGARLSRHIPDRDEMDMAVSSFNLKARRSVSQLSDSSYCESADDGGDKSKSQYNERLAGRLLAPQSKKLGGEVLSFRNRERSRNGPLSEIKHSVANLVSNTMRQQQAPQHRARQLNCNPERILDAPELPSFPSAQLIDWGINNKLVIGLRSNMFVWDAVTQKAQQVLQMNEACIVRNVLWMTEQPSAVVLSLVDGTTAVLDTCTSKFLRDVKPLDTTVSQLAVRESILAVASNTDSGCIHLFDLRLGRPKIATFDGHHGRVTALSYGSSEPFYLGSGTADGSVCVWDARRPGSSRYFVSRVHNGAVSALRWNPDKRSMIFSGGVDSALNVVDIHGSASSSQRPSVAQSVNTRYPVTGIICPPNAGEVVTSHNGAAHLQLRKVLDFSLSGTFTPATTALGGISCICLAPDMERVCSAVQDETLKFWRVFRAPQTSSIVDFDCESLR